MPNEQADPTQQDTDAGPGPLNQEDIDALETQISKPKNALPGGQTTGGELSQADIDAALNAQVDSDASKESSQDSGSVEFSQADIDAALNKGHGGSSQEASSPAAGESSTQDEIDAVLAAAQAGAQSLSESGVEQDQSDGSADTRLDTTGRPFDAAAAAMAEAIEKEAADSPESTPPPETRPVDLPDFSDEEAANAPRDISILRDVDLKVHIELGRTLMYIEDVLKLTQGSVVELDNLAGDPVDVYVNGRLVARGEVLVLSDNFCVRISEIVSGPQNVSVA